MRERLTEDAVQRLVGALIQRGASPAYHRAQLIRLRIEWPVLASALKAMLVELNAPIPQEWMGVRTMMPALPIPSTPHLQGLEAQNAALRECLRAAGVRDDTIEAIAQEAYAAAQNADGDRASDVSG